MVMVLQERKIRLSKAVRLRDAFTGEPVAAGVKVSSLSGGKVEKKREGYFLFLDVADAGLEMEAESPIYQKRRLTLPADFGECVEEVFLYPSPAYPLRQGVSVVRGRTKPLSVLKFHVRDGQGNVRLIHDYQKGEEEISFYKKDRSPGGLWYIQKKGKEEGEYFRTESVADEGERYRLRQPLSRTYQKKDTLICQAQESMADEEGEFYLLLPDPGRETCMLHYSCESKGKVTEGEAEILKGHKNSLFIK